MHIEDRARKVKVVLIDVDGVLTDGKMIYGNYGDELKAFDVQDGLGIQLLKAANIYIFIITGRFSKIILKRAKELKVSEVFQNVNDKLKLYEKLKRKLKLADENFCCIGDDLLDLPLIKRAGLSCAVSNAQEEVKEKAHYITSRAGGCGAVREVINIILKSQNKWKEVTAKFYK